MAVTQEKSARGDPAAERLAGIQVLVIISSDRAAKLVRDLFHNLGFVSLHVAADGAGAMQQLRSQRYHFVVTDVDLNISTMGAVRAGKERRQEKRMSGIELVRLLRTHQHSPAPFIPVLMLMDYADSYEVVRARDAGINEIVLKPLEAYDFCARIIAMIDKPRIFVTARSYRGPCRRRAEQSPPTTKERRIREIKLVRCHEAEGLCV